jgi:GTP-binding protein LepA
MKNIRNFCIIAHIDHGKSTLADRLLEYTGTVSAREAQEQLLDDMDLERERGITIKSHAIQMNYKLNGEEYILNLIDTPGHVDFSYEVSRAIAACEGALLIVDAAQGIQAQTISNLYLALEHDLEIIPVMNKIDLPSARARGGADQIMELIGCKRDEIISASGKDRAWRGRHPPCHRGPCPRPRWRPDAPLQALIFDSVFNPFRGIIAYFRVMNGKMKKGEAVKFVATPEGVPCGRDRYPQMEVSPHRTERRQRGLHHQRHQDRQRGEGGRHHHQRPASMHRLHPWFRGCETDGVRRHLSRWTRTSMKSCVPLWRSCN